MTMSNSVYCALKRQGLHNWGFLTTRQLELDLNDIDLDDWDSSDLDIFLSDLEEQGGLPDEPDFSRQNE